MNRFLRLGVGLTAAAAFTAGFSVEAEPVVRLTDDVEPVDPQNDCEFNQQLGEWILREYPSGQLEIIHPVNGDVPAGDPADCN